MIELLACRNFFPSARRVTRLASLCESSAVGIAVAVGTLRECDAGESRRTARCFRRVAFHARHLRVQTSEWIPCFGVIEIVRRLPVNEIVALRAVGAEFAFVRVLVATCTILRQAQERVAQVLHLDQRFCGWLNVRRGVALTAFQARVFALQRIARLLVVEFFERWLPVNERVTFAVMFGVARGAIRPVGKLRVQPAPAG